MGIKKSGWVCQGIAGLLVFLLILMPVMDLSPALAAQTQSDCEQEIKKAEMQYTIGRFDEALQILNNCQQKPGLPKDQETRIYRLLGYVYLAKEIEANAKMQIGKLLDLVPNYQPDPVKDTPEYIALVKKVQEERQKPPVPPPTEKKKGGSKKWLFIGGGVLLAGGAAILLLGGDGDNGKIEEDLPGPPVPPGN